MVEGGAAVTTAAMPVSGAIAERRYRVQKDYRGVLPQEVILSDALTTLILPPGRPT